MKFFVDTAEIDQIKELAETGMVDGVTTNPSLIVKSGRDFLEVLEEICELVDGPVSGEVTATDAEGMIREGEKLARIAENITVKLPMTWDGLKACRYFASKNIMTNVTLCFSPAQALLAAKAGATFVSPFVGRLDDLAQDGMQLIEDIRNVYDNYPALNTEILVASVRHPMHVMDAAKIGADVVTLPAKVLKQLITHPLTDKGLAAFLVDWEKSGQNI